MNDNPYHVISGCDIPFYGREQLLQLILKRLMGRIHVSAIAPRFFGKTCLLREIAKRVKTYGFAHCIWWDLRTPLPHNNDEFFVSLSRQLERQAMLPGQDLVEHFRELGICFETINSVFIDLAKEGLVLLIIDGVDKVLRSGDLTIEVWDNLRTLSDIPNMRLLTASRAPLREICPPDSEGSPFWNIFFQGSVLFGCFQAADWSGILMPFADREITFDDSALKELSNWTGGIPVLAIAICERLYHSATERQVLTKVDVDGAAVEASQAYHDLIETMWEDLPAETRYDLQELLENKELSRAGRPPDRIKLLTQRGLALESGGNKLKSACRLMEQFASMRGQNLPEMKKLFSARNDYERNIIDVLQLRLVQAKGLNEKLDDHVEHLVKELPDPDKAKGSIRGVADLFLNLLIQQEFGNGPINPAWVSDWKFRGKLNNPENDRDLLEGRIPLYRGPRMKLLSLLHDEKCAGTAKTRRSTFLLLDALFAAGSYGQHSTDIGESVSRGFVTAIAALAVELLHQIREDIRP